MTDGENAHAHRILGTLAELIKTLPAPHDTTEHELRAALAIYEEIVTPQERLVLVRIAIVANLRCGNLVLTIVALMRYVAAKLRMTVAELRIIVADKRTIVGLAIGL